MKELSIEQKAKAYDEAIERAKEIHNEQCAQPFNVMLKVFPELKESEDERIRKALMKNLKERFGTKGNMGEGLDMPDVLAWLEKQGSEPNWRHHKVDLSECPEEYRKAYYDGWNNCNMQNSQCKSDNNDVIKCLINGMKFYYDDIPGATWGTDKWSMPVKHIIETLEAINKEEAVEEGTIKHKFGVGNWITDESGRVWHIDDIDDEGYLVSMYENGYVTILPFTIDNIYSLWDIKDAKDGDILATEDNCICIFDNTLEEGKYPFAYCGLTRYVFEVYDRRLPFTHNNVYPATKKQCDLLFQKMKEAGYEWDSNRKELKKTGQKPTNEEMQSEQESNWSEEDNKHLERILRELENQCQRPSNRPYLEEIESDYDWIRSIKDRVLHRQEWDEEGQVRMNRIISNLKNLKVARNDILLKDIDWLKSIRPQLQWKPSDEQMVALDSATENCAYSEYQDCLRELIVQLKKLRGE